MMDEIWSRGWAEAHKAALQAREGLARDGRPAPSLWDDLRKLVRDLITPQAGQPAEDGGCEPSTCHSAA